MWDGNNFYIYEHQSVKLLVFSVSWWRKEKVINRNPKTMGSGGNYAYEALELGLTPEEAICYAADRDPYTDTNVKKMAL